jgi:hypothetical protein
LAGESALAVLGYLAAYGLCLERGGVRARLVSLVPYAAVVLAWGALYRGLGYGTSGSGVYLDPIGDFGPFVAALPKRLVWLLAAQLALPWSDFASLYAFAPKHVEPLMLSVAVALVVFIGACAVPLVRRDATARFFAVGTVLAALPACATFPADRLLWFAGVGAMGLCAQLLSHARPRLADRAVAALLIALHLVAAPPLLALRARSMVTAERPLARANDSLPRTPDVSARTFVLINPPADPFAGYVVLTRAARGEPRPARLRWLATGAAGVTLERVDERTLRVRPLHGFLEHATERMLRRRPFTVGEKVSLAGMTVEVTRVGADGRAAEALVRFALPLEDPSLYFTVWQHGYRPFAPPPVGAAVTLPPVNVLGALFAR